MKKVVIYPGTFDPITFGHIDVIKKALRLFDKIIVAASDGNNKDYLFNPNERVKIIKKALFSDLKLEKRKIVVILFLIGQSNTLIYLLQSRWRRELCLLY